MENILLENGFKKGYYPNEYVRGSWTIRLDGFYLEVFDDLMPEGSGSYFYGESSYENLEKILEDIDDSYLEFGQII